MAETRKLAAILAADVVGYSRLGRCRGGADTCTATAGYDTRRLPLSGDGALTAGQDAFNSRYNRSDASRRRRQPRPRSPHASGSSQAGIQMK
jgi:hypothetical protein